MKGSLEKGSRVFWVVGIITQFQHTVDENTNKTGAWKKGILKTVIKVRMFSAQQNSYYIGN